MIDLNNIVDEGKQQMPIISLKHFYYHFLNSMLITTDNINIGKKSPKFKSTPLEPIHIKQ